MVNKEASGPEVVVEDAEGTSHARSRVMQAYDGAFFEDFTTRRLGQIEQVPKNC